MAKLPRDRKPKREPLIGVEDLRRYPWLTLKPGESFTITCPGLAVIDVRQFRDALWFLHGVRVMTRTVGTGVYVARVN